MAGVELGPDDEAHKPNFVARFAYLNPPAKDGTRAILYVCAKERFADKPSVIHMRLDGGITDEQALRLAKATIEASQTAGFMPSGPDSALLTTGYEWCPPATLTAHLEKELKQKHG